MKRLVLYFLQDKRAVAGTHVRFLLDELSKYSKDIIMLCADFLKLSDCVSLPVSRFFKPIHQQNKLSVFSEILRDIGWDKLLEYDEILYVNDHVFGPLGSMAEWFAYIDEKYIDFWGLVENFHERDTEQKYISMNFIALRKNIIHSGAFQKWIETDALCDDCPISTSKLLSDKLVQLGFKYETWVQLNNIDKLYNDPMLQVPDKLVLNYQLPFFLIDSFALDYGQLIKYCDGRGARRLYEHLVSIGYDVNNIWDTLCRNTNQADWYNCLHLNYVIDDCTGAEISKNLKIALMMHLYYMDVLDISLQYAGNMPPNCDIYVTTDCEIKKSIILEKFQFIKCNSLRVIVVENRGRSESGFCIGLKPYVSQYQYICFFHDKKTTQTSPGSVGNDFWYKCLDNILASEMYVENILNLFEKNEKLGLVMSRPPIHSSYFPVHGVYGWGSNYENVKKLMKELKVNVPMDRNKEPLAPLGSMFWFRPDALKALWEKEWEYEDFPPEPNSADGTLLHAIERSYSFIAQNAGFYSAYVMTKDSAELDLNGLSFYLSEVNRKIYEKGWFNDLSSALQVLDSRL